MQQGKMSPGWSGRHACSSAVRSVPSVAQGFEESALPLPKSLQKAGAAAVSAVKSAANSVKPAAAPAASSAPAPKKEFVNPLLQKRQSAPKDTPKKEAVNPLLQKRAAAATTKKEEPKNILAPAAAAAGGVPHALVLMDP